VAHILPVESYLIAFATDNCVSNIYINGGGVACTSLLIYLDGNSQTWATLGLFYYQAALSLYEIIQEVVIAR
jgi:hypothetical protein